MQDGTAADSMSQVPEQFLSVLTDAVQQWSPGGRFEVLRPLSGGRSGAFVAIVDIAPITQGRVEGGLVSGQYVLKLDAPQYWPSDAEPQEEHQRHRLAFERDAVFSKRHIPHLRHIHRDQARPQSVALLYDIAGGSAYNTVGAAELAASPLQRCCRELAKTLLRDFNKNMEVKPMTAAELLSDWLGYRLRPADAPELHELLDRVVGDRPAFSLGGEALINPRWLCAGAPPVSTTQTFFVGLIHGDMHSDNVLVRADDQAFEYWLIDFANCRVAPVLYDHTYFELSLLLPHLEGLGSERLYGILRSLDAPKQSTAASYVPPADSGILEAIRTLRTAADHWQTTKEPKRLDAYRAQVLLSRVAVGLNWANKDMSEHSRRAAITYAGWAAKQYVANFHRAELASLLAEADTLRAAPAALLDGDSKVAPDSEVWKKAWDECMHFDESEAKFVLITGRMDAIVGTSLGLLPWSVVIDLDPQSDRDGLYSGAGPLLRRLRLVSHFSRRDLADPEFAFCPDRATVWAMCGGWPSRQEPIPGPDEWRRRYVPLVRTLLRHVRTTVAPQPVKIILCPGDGVDSERARLLLTAVDEVFESPGDVLVCGRGLALPQSLAGAQLAISPVAFARCVHSTFGAEDNAAAVEIPAASGSVPILPEQLRDIEVDLELVHSRILHAAAAQPRDRDAFWRGTPPTWGDLHAGLDVTRQNQGALLERVLELLNSPGTYTVELRHMPGSGGTTSALRLAWALRSQFPVTVLRRYATHTADKVDQLYQLAQRPLLLVADASVLGMSSREELFRELASRHTRLVLLYVVRSLSAAKNPWDIRDPLSQTEAENFLATYSQRTANQKRLRALKKNTRSPERAAYRTPFFYGLITYEEKFRKVGDYVAAHLHGISPRILAVLRHLAVIARFSQATVDIAILRQLLGLKADSHVDAQRLFGTANRLLARTGRKLTVMHRLVADAILDHSAPGDDWKSYLQGWSIELIRDFVDCCGPHEKGVRDLFVQVFIRRDEWGASGGGNFSELLGAVQTTAGRHTILQELTQQCPDEAHFWNHLGRHQIYEMRTDYEAAERYLQQAVRLSGNDPLHHHSLGMVRRLWVERQLEQLFAQAPTQLPPTSDEVLDAIEPLASRAGEAFERSRQLRRENEHGYVTHVQLVAAVSEFLLRTLDVRQCRGLGEITGRPAVWLQRNLVLASGLLDDLRNIRPEVDVGANPSRKVLDCESRVQTLLGGLDHVISSWESLVSSGRNDADLRSALMVAYYRRRSRNWGALNENELVRVRDLADANLRDDPTSARDVVMWLHASRRLPTFSFVKALDRLGVWAERTEDIDAFYYLFCMHFTLWRLGKSLDEEQIRSWSERLDRTTAARRVFSYEWWGTEPEWCPLLHHRDLGDWQPPSGEHNPKLAWLDGTIDEIRGPQAGWIRLGRLTRAFFRPGNKFHAPRDINRVVRFYGGFSYGGLRAWCVEFIGGS